MIMNPLIRTCRFLLTVLLLSNGVLSKLCDITSGESAIILDISESDGPQTDQVTSPENLPIEGIPGEDILLALSQDQQYFSLDGSRLSLNKPLDRDKEDLSTIRFQVLCTIVSTKAVQTIAVVVRVSDINDNAPIFQSTPYTVTIREDIAIGTTVFRNIKATDMDSGLNQQIEYSIIPGDDSIPAHQDGFGSFSINLPYQGFITVNSTLDFETTTVYYLKVQASDQSINEPRKMTTTTVTIRIKDADDQNPKFILNSCRENPTDTNCPAVNERPIFKASVISGRLEGVLSVEPDRILALDSDSLRAPIRYSFVSGSPLSYMQYFSMDTRTAVVSQVAPVDRSISALFNITIKAEEQTSRKGSSFAQLQIYVTGVDKSPPQLVASSYYGKVDEASPPGTFVSHDNDPNTPISFSVTDPDLQPGEALPSYFWELTTSSFKVNEEGILIVADPGLDRDPPSLGVHKFQVIARESHEGGAASAPVTISVELNDVNDNPPRFPVYRPITVTAGTQRRALQKIAASDKDAGLNGEVTYSISAVSRGRKDLFSIDRNTALLEILSEVSVGEQYSVTITGRDGGGLESMTVVDVQVARAPNTGGPTFSKSSYTVVMSEDSVPGSRVITLKAKDPEGDIPIYSILSGNEMEYFDIDGLSGTITVSKPLDRETVKNFNLIVQAEDEEKQSSTATVIIMVGDVNDVVPSFIDLPYSFRIDEGVAQETLGTLKAEDTDSGNAGKVSYSLGENDYFEIDPNSGILTAVKELDYETQQVHYLKVIASDEGIPQQQASATVTILVNDMNDEEPIFSKSHYDAQIKESAQPGTVIVTVTATDADNDSQITYEIRSGPKDLFVIDPETGIISSIGELDYEKNSSHTLIIGTKENLYNNPLATTEVLIKVEDLNDHTPVFDPVSPSLVPSAVPTGTLITTVHAVDLDGSPINNHITYELSGEESDKKYFEVDSTYGTVRVAADLTDVPKTNYELKVVARDNGNPPLLSSVDVKITIIRSVIPQEGDPTINGQSAPVVVQTPASFVNREISIDVLEDVIEGHVLTKLQVANKPKDYATNFKCSILESHLHDMFEVVVDHEGDCILKMSSQRFDYEEKDHYNITVALHSLATPLPTPETTAMVSINIVDVNDNAPMFLMPEESLVKGSENHPIIYTLIDKDAEIGSPVMHIKAKDADSGPGGVIKYSLVPGSNRGGYFTVEAETGIIKSVRLLTAVPYQLLPFNLTLLAMDDPNHPTVHHTTSASIVINVKDSSSQIVLGLNAPLNQVQNNRHQVAEVIGKHSSHLVLIDKIEEHKYINGTKILSDSSATDVWFNIIDQNTGKLLPRINPSVLPFVLDGADKDALLSKISESLENMDAFEIRDPKLEAPTRIEISNDKDAKSVKTLDSYEGGQLALFTLGAAIILLGTIAIVVICFSWMKYVKRRNAAEKTLMVLAPSIDHCDSVLDSSTKEYEVQVLHMSVPMDDESVHEVMPARSRHHISLDNVSYISKHNYSRDVSSSDGDHTPNTNSPRMEIMPGTNGWSTSKSIAAASVMPGRNPAYDRFSDHLNEDEDQGPLSISATNENVLFGRRQQPDHSPVEDTTEL